MPRAIPGGFGAVSAIGGSESALHHIRVYRVSQARGGASDSSATVGMSLGVATAERMTRHVFGAGLYAPLRVLLYEEPEGVFFEYDLPSSLFGQFGDGRVKAVGRELDVELEKALRAAARGAA